MQVASKSRLSCALPRLIPHPFVHWRRWRVSSASPRSPVGKIPLRWKSVAAPVESRKKSPSISNIPSNWTWSSWRNPFVEVNDRWALHAHRALCLQLGPDLLRGEKKSGRIQNVECLYSYIHWKSSFMGLHSSAIAAPYLYWFRLISRKSKSR